jgi:hypothetical protein
LTLLNDSFIAEQAGYFAERLVAESPGDARAQVQRAWRLAYGAPAREEDTSRSLVYLAEQTEQIRARLSALPAPKKDDKSPPRDPQKLALTSLCQALLGANRFIYVD